MKIQELANILGAETLQAGGDDTEVTGGYASDLLSDVMANAKTGDALITIQAHRNTVAVAVLIGAPAIVICNKRPIPADMLEAAREEGIAVILTKLNQFEVSGRLWQALAAK
jgi:hypothetical protein